jgi:hypothetical protein
MMNNHHCAAKLVLQSSKLPDISGHVGTVLVAIAKRATQRIDDD